MAENNKQMQRPGFGGGPGRRGMMATGKPKDAKKTIRRIFTYLQKDKLTFIAGIICVVISTITSLIGSYFQRPIINSLKDNAEEIANATGSTAEGILKASVTALLQILSVMAIVYIITIVSSYIQSRIMLKISQHALWNLRNDLFKEMEKLPIRFFDTTNHGEIMSRYTNDVDAINNMLTQTIPSLISAVITVVGTLFFMFYTSWVLSIITILSVPVIAVIGLAIVKRARKYYSAQQAAIGKINGYIEEAITGQKIIKVFNHEDRTIKEFDVLNKDLKGKQEKAAFIGSVNGPVMNNLNQIFYSITALIGGLLCVTRGFDIGGLSFFVTISRQFSRPINEVSNQMHTIFSALAGAERVFAVMDHAPEEMNESGITDEIKGHVVFNDVTFGYNPDKTVLKNISLYAKPGQKIAFVGSTGAGKTTITNLINRFYDIQSGTITIDDKDVTSYSLPYLRQNIAMVLQDTHLFTGTVRENIRYGRLDATDDEVVEAAKIASAHSFIMRLENGYDTVLDGDGANLSQGQRQLLNIARAAISKAPILVLDEATSSVDTRTERHIEHGMDRLMKNRTTFVIAHRLSTVRNSNAIMVLEKGEIIERGTHDDLLAMKGRYYELYTGVKELD